MPVTAQAVFDRALTLMDEVLETGVIATETPAYYKTKAIQTLNILQLELLPITAVFIPINDLTEPLQVNDRQAYLVLPYGLAAHLLINDDLTISSFFNARYDELKKKYSSVSTPEPIVDVYSVLGVEG
ncbi:hypothetical protein [Paenisporosarcina cavernae]|uniref:Uncharacterized protein n=1 Tax=Paenisporosarcina cavernae TaxID=2320858 RepID=A0A385YSY9_9BACL|nr:hypothetical protein [Paenisporosarcina cavernae]AYC29644.1 hypothetical protein D3873_06985 [Paenisporosarcina cavernae]AYC30008.1 hypothetical protein D3873_09035 [Paenisporosarcina cavernae]